MEETVEGTCLSFSCEPSLERLEVGLVGGEALGDFLALPGDEEGEQEEPLFWSWPLELLLFLFS